MTAVNLFIFILTILSLNAQSPDELYGDLFKAVQNQPVFNDSKTFCDSLPRSLTPPDIVALYNQQHTQTGFNLTAFVYEHFILPNTTDVIHEKWTIKEHCLRLWKYLTRTVDRENFSSIIPVPDSFVVPGGRFREFYYWDTYFTMLGLRRSNETQLINNMLENFAFLIRNISHIPNGNRYYYRGRSQPPFFAFMTNLVGKSDQYKNELEKEYEFWMTKRNITLDDGSVLNRYYDDISNQPRPEAYREDIETASKANNSKTFVNIRAAAESGWDFSSRWLKDETDLSTIETTDLLPVDLNCLLYYLELTLNKQNEAQRRRQAIHQYMWSNDVQFFTDYNFIEKKQTNRLTLAGVYPLWLNISTEQQSIAVARRIQSDFLHDGGVVTTLSTKSTQQWDSPNGWAPLQYVTYRALLQTPGFESVASTLRQRWMNLNERVFMNTSKMMEKYDVVNMHKPAGGGEYQTQDGFGWTNGVYLEMLFIEEDRPSSSNSNQYRSSLLPITLIMFLVFYLFS